jgi:hypothetical protein
LPVSEAPTEDLQPESEEPSTPSEVSMNPERNETSQKHGRQAMETELNQAMINFFKARSIQAYNQQLEGSGIIQRMQLLEESQRELSQSLSQRLETLDQQINSKLDALLIRRH